MNAAEVLRKTLEMFGENGEQWAHHAGPIEGGTCVWGGIYQAIERMTGEEPHGDCDKWTRILGFNSSSEMFAWNDDEQRTFAEVKARIEKAIAEQEAA